MVRFFFNWKFTILLALALLSVVAVPFAGEAVGLKQLMTVTLSAVMIASVLTLSRGKRLTGALALVLPCLVFLWWGEFHLPYGRGSEMKLMSAVLQSLFIAYMIFMILAVVLKAPRVTAEVISAAVVAYLFMAFFFGRLYLVLEMVYPGSFSLPQGADANDPAIWEYFSMITLSTLGYGDIVPVTQRARVMAGGQAMVGQIYLAVLVARLVSLYSGTSASEEDGK